MLPKSVKKGESETDTVQTHGQTDNVHETVL